MDVKSVTDIFSGLLNMESLLVPGLLPTWGKLILFGIPLCLYLAAAMLPFIVLVGLVRAQYGRKSLFERCSRQVGRLSNLLNWIFLICTAISIGYFGFSQQYLAAMPPVLRLGIYEGGFCLLAGTILWTLVMAAWKSLRSMPFIHGILAFLAGSCLAALPVIALLCGRAHMQGVPFPDVLDYSHLTAFFLPALDGVFWMSVALLHGGEMAAAGGVALCWLLIRRNRDDYGRDYYAFAAKWCGTWAAWGGWLTLICLACALYFLAAARTVQPEGAFPAFFMLVSLLFLLISSLLWTGIARSGMPMRHKIGMVLSVCLLIISTASAGILLL